MIKKSFLALFTCLIIGGLLMVGSTNAMTYTIEGNHTIVKIPESPIDTGIIINRGDGTTKTMMECELREIANGVDGYQCSHTYSGYGTKTINIENKNYLGVESIYIASGDVTTISNLDQFSSLSAIYANNNNITEINASALNGMSNVALHLETNYLTDFKPNLSNIKNLYLFDNQLTTIPSNIRASRLDHKIYLSNSTFIGEGSKNIYIYNKVNGEPDNKINFIGITGIGDNYSTDNPDYYINNGYPYNFTDTTTYKFEWFAYSWNTSPLNYNWGIYKNGIIEPIAYPNVLTSSQSVTYDQALAPGDYTFKVWYTDNTSTSHEASINFDVSYSLGINFTSQTTVNNGGSIEPQDTIKFTWEKDGGYPENFIGSPKFYIELIDTDSSNIIFNGETSNTSYTLTDETKGQLENGKTYTFNVYILDTDGNHIQADDKYIINTNCDYGDYSCYYDYIHASRSFTISIPEIPIPTIQIDRPNNQETGSITHFSWTPTIPDGNEFTNYTWNIKDNNNTTVTGGTINNQTKTGLSIDNLSNGTYTFYVELNYKRDGNTQDPVTDTTYNSNGTKTFTVAKTYPTIRIIRPSDTETGNITYFSWEPNITPGFTFDNYEWSISKNGTPIITRQYTNLAQTSYETGGLNNGEYIFNVKLNYTQDSNGQAGYAIDNTYAATNGDKTFNVNKSNELTITYPSHDGARLSEAENTFRRTGFTANTFRKYTYTLTGDTLSGDHYSTGGSFTSINQNSFTLRNLRDGEYTLIVTMETDAGNETDTRRFTVNASELVYLTITSPNKPTYTGNYIKTVPIDFTWNGGGSPLISRYTYTIKDRDASTLRASGSVDKNDAGSYFIPGTSLALPSGTYRFEVTMLDNDRIPIIEPKSYNFNVVIPSYLEILTPPEGQLNIKDVSFSRSGFAEFEHHYKYEVNRVDNQGNIISTIKTENNIPLTTKSFSLHNLHNGKYIFCIELMDNSDHPIIKKERTFRIPDDLDLILDISDGNSSVTTLKSKKGIFSWGGRSEDFAGYSYSIQGTTFKNETYLYTGRSEGATTGSITLNDLSTGRYRFSVNMLNANGGIITGKHLDFTVSIPASLNITNPKNGSTITSSSTTLSRVGNGDIFRTGYSNDSRHYEYELLQVIASGYEQKAVSPRTNANSFSYNSFQDGASYQLNVKLYSGTTLLARDTSNFSVSIPKKSSGGGGGGSSSKSHPTNDLSVSITNDEPVTNERVEVVVDISDKYTGKVDFTKMQYYSFDEEKRIDIPVTSKNYVSDYSDDAKLGYVKFDSSDDGEKNLSEFLMFSQPGNYRIHVEDKDGYNDYVQFYVGKGNNKTQVTTTKEPEQDEDEYYIARSCKKYKIEYLDNLGVYSSPNLKKEEYFINKDYFKRYIDSKNKQINGCPTNVGWISTTYKDTSNSSDRYAAPNGKVYFINGQNGSYSSTQLDKELNGAKKFSTINELKYFIRDRNPFINMSAPVK